MKDSTILIVFVIVLVIIICLSCKTKKNINQQKKTQVIHSTNFTNLTDSIIKKSQPNQIIYEEIINGGITDINYHCKITLNNIYIFNSHSTLINKPINDKYYTEILLFVSNINKNDLYEIQSKEDHIGDYEILNNIIRINGININYKKLEYFANYDEKYNKYKIAIDKIRDYKSMQQKF